MPPFDTLLQIDSDLTDWLVSTAATTDDQRAQMTRVLALRADLDRQINALIGYRLQMAVKVLPDQTQLLGQAAMSMRSADHTIATVQTVLSAVGTAVSVAAKLATAVM